MVFKNGERGAGVPFYKFEMLNDRACFWLNSDNKVHDVITEESLDN